MPGKLVNTQNELHFPALISSNNFATIEYEAHHTTKIDYIDYSINHVFKTKSFIELNTISGVERTQFLIILAMSVKIHK